MVRMRPRVRAPDLAPGIMAKIAIIIPSRGLIHSRTVEAVFNNLEGFDCRVFVSHDLPIPDCFNVLVGEAKQWGAKYVWFVEEDTVPPPDTLFSLLTAPGDVKAYDYPIDTAGTPVTSYTASGEVLFTGMGCMLVPMAVLDKTGLFRSDLCYSLKGGQLTLEPDWTRGYGGQDVHFGVRLKEEGFTTTIVGQADHLRVRNLGQPDTNHGAHDIYALPVDKLKAA